MSKDKRWTERCSEPSVEELLADPVLHALIEADGVSPSDLKALIDDSRRPFGKAPYPALACRPSQAKPPGAEWTTLDMRSRTASIHLRAN